MSGTYVPEVIQYIKKNAHTVVKYRMCY